MALQILLCLYDKLNLIVSILSVTDSLSCSGERERETWLACFGNNASFNQFMLCTANLFLFFVKDINYFYTTLQPATRHVFNAGIKELVNTKGLKVKQ